MDQKFPVRVYYEDTDSMGVVYHANYLRYLERAGGGDAVVDVSVDKERGIVVPGEARRGWERGSVPLRVPAAYGALFSSFQAYFRTEAGALGDPKLAQETDLLDKLIRAAPPPPAAETHK